MGCGAPSLDGWCSTFRYSVTVSHWTFRPLKMKSPRCLETSGTKSPIDIPEDWRPHLHRCESQKNSHFSNFFFSYHTDSGIPVGWMILKQTKTKKYWELLHNYSNLMPEFLFSASSYKCKEKPSVLLLIVVGSSWQHEAKWQRCYSWIRGISSCDWTYCYSS
jgi:hypothetical protein